MKINLIEYVVLGESESIRAETIIRNTRIKKRARTAQDVAKLYQIEARRVMAALTGAGVKFEIRYHPMMGCPHKLVADWNRGRQKQKKMAIVG